ncbi:MAG: hypothetical protein AB1758_22810 [Candidatus Eremiobacterota bacterium]
MSIIESIGTWGALESAHSKHSPETPRAQPVARGDGAQISAEAARPPDLAEEQAVGPLTEALAANYGDTDRAGSQAASENAGIRSISFHATVEKGKLVEPGQELGKIETSHDGRGHGAGRRGPSAEAGNVEDERNTELPVPKNGNSVVLPARSVMLEQLSSGPLSGDLSGLMKVLQEGQTEPGRLNFVA